MKKWVVQLNKSVNKRFLMWSILLIAMVQMPSLALMPGIHQIHQVFSDRSLSTIQTVMNLPNFISPFVTITASILIGKGLLTKKSIIVTGLFLVALTGVLSTFANTQFWHLVLLSCVLGLGLSGYISNASSLIIDNFTIEERQKISGYQTSFINCGGILMSLCGGLLATIAWYGGYLMLLVALPVAIVAILAIPNLRMGAKAKDADRDAGTEKIRLHTDILLYGVLIFVFMAVYNVVGANASTHLATQGLGNSSVSGYITAIRMLGGVICGLFFSKLSRKLGDFTTVLAFLVVFFDMTMLSVAKSIVTVIIGEIIGGMGLSLMLPQCLFSVSKVVNKQSSAVATSITSCIAPSFGSFFSPLIFTNLTTALYGESTVLRYRFVSFVALACAVIVGIIFAIRKKRQAAKAPEQD